MYMKRILLMVGMSLAMLIPTSCTEKLNRNSNKVDKTKDWTEVVTMVVSSEIGTVYGMEGVPSEGMKIKEEGKKDWNPAYFSEIEGFEYVRGFEYHLKVEKTHLVDPPQDASSVKYKLIEILSEEFKLGEGYVMRDDYIHYGPTSNNGEEHRETITKAEGEYYIAILKSMKTEALAFLADNGFTIMENSDEETGEFYALRGKLKDCFQITVKGNSSVADVPGALYTSPLYNNDEWFKVDTFGRGNMILLGFSYRWDDEKIMRHIPYIEKYAEILNIYLIRKDLSEYGNYLLFGVTEESAGNAVEIHNWFSEVAGYHICDLDFPEFAATID